MSRLAHLMAGMDLAGLKNFVRRILDGFFSENTFNTVAYCVFYVGYVTQTVAIERPVRQQLGDLGEVVVIQHRANPYFRFMRGLACFGYVFHVFFQTLQMVRFIPAEGFTLRVVWVVYYFAVQLLCSLLTYVILKYEETVPYTWNCIEANTKMCQRYGVREAAKWKCNPMALLMLISVALGSNAVCIKMVILYAVKPNLPAHSFYLLPEPWKAYTTAYLALLSWQAFMCFAGVSMMNYFAAIGVAFTFGTKAVAVETASSADLSVLMKMRIFRAIEMVTQIADELVRNLCIPMLSFVTVAVGVTFTYIALTRYGDPHLPLPVYAFVVFIDVIIVSVITLAYVQIGKCSDASAELIESIRISLKEPRTLGNPRLPYLRKKLAAFRRFDLDVGSYAKVDIHLVRLMHETIVDYLMLLLEL